MISESYSGSQAATVGTAHTLNTTTPETTDGVYQLFIDISALAAGDTLEITIKEKCTATSATAIVMQEVLSGAQSQPLWASPAILLLHGWDMTIKQTAGTGRTFDYSIRKVS